MKEPGRFRKLMRAWADFMYEGLLPPDPDPKQQSAKIYDWRGCCKYCGKPKDDIRKTEWL